MLLKFLVLIFIACSFVHSQSHELVDILKNIRSEEQLHFVQFHVTRGYFRSNRIPTRKYERGYSGEYSKKLFETLQYLSKAEYSNSTKIKPSYNTQIKKDLQIRICTPEGICFDPDDSGIHP